MKRWVLMAVAGTAIVGTAACGGGTVVVQAQVEGDSAIVPLANMEVRALPYDRDAIFDSLAAAYAQPEPQIPDSLAALQQEYTQLEQAYSTAEGRWGTIRDSLQFLSDTLATLPRGSTAYQVLFLDFNELSGQEGAAKRRMDQAFAAREAVREGYTMQVTDLRNRRELWADEAYAPFTDVKLARLDELGRDEVPDTTDANGVVTLRLPRGQWWIHARHDLVFEELYWNVPIQVEGGDPQQIMLTRETAQVRPKY